MPTIALVGPYNQIMKDAFYQSVPESFRVIEIPSEKEYPLMYQSNVDYILNRTSVLTADDIAACKQLKMIAKYAVGYDNIDIAAAAQRGIPVVNCNGFNSDSVAELTILLMLAVLRNLMPQSRALLNSHWSQDEYVSRSFLLKNQTVGVVGMGNIGTRVAKLVRAFGGKVLYYDVKRMSDQEEQDIGVVYVSFEKLLASSDIVTMHVPGSKQTQHMIGAPQLAMMKEGSYLINCARGPVVDEKALYEALSSGHLAGCGLDVFEEEPPGKDPILTLPNVAATPHVGGSTFGIGAGMIRFCVENIRAFEEGRPLPEKNIVNMQMLERASDAAS